MRRKVILDVDTGADDAVAIMLAALHPDLDLIACTTVNGNAEVGYCTDNTLRALDHVGRGDVPVYEGLSRPIARRDFPIPRAPNDHAARIHGKTLPLPPTLRRKAEMGAAEFLLKIYRAAAEEITLIALAPLSNVAAALALDPDFAARVPHLLIMGGGHATGNVTAAAEFNMHCDPEAAAMTLASGFRRITLVPLDATHEAVVSREDCARLAALGTAAGGAAAALIGQAIDFQDSIASAGAMGVSPVHDALCVAALIDPTLIATRRLHVAVETSGALTTGRTVMDMRRRASSPAPNCDVAFDADARRFMELLASVFGGVSRP